MARDSRKARKPKKRKERFVARLKRRGRETYGLGQTLVQEPRAFPAALGSILKRSFRSIWEARGGGFYACGFAMTFVWLEVQTVVSEISAADGVVAFLSEQLLEFVFRFSLQSLGNTIQALVWPALLIEHYELWGLGLLAVAYLLFARLLKEPLSRWLFADREPEQANSIDR